MKTLESKDLDYWLDNITVTEVDDYHNEVNDYKLSGVLGWFYVADDTGVIAYFGKENDAFHFRLDLINRKLNP